MAEQRTTTTGAALADLKAYIRRALQDGIVAFHEETGLTPSGIEIRMIEVTTSEDSVRQHAVSEVIIELGRL